MTAAIDVGEIPPSTGARPTKGAYRETMVGVPAVSLTRFRHGVAG